MKRPSDCKTSGIARGRISTRMSMARPNTRKAWIKSNSREICMKPHSRSIELMKMKSSRPSKTKHRSRRVICVASASNMETKLPCSSGRRSTRSRRCEAWTEKLSKMIRIVSYKQCRSASMMRNRCVSSGEKCLRKAMTSKYSTLRRNARKKIAFIVLDQPQLMLSAMSTQNSCRNKNHS